MSVNRQGGEGVPFTSETAKRKPGRKKGAKNRATLQAREAIARFVDGNAHRLQKWLDDVADGVMVTEKNSKGDEVERYLIVPDPERAFLLFQSVIEYHVPKLARTELTGQGGGPVVISATDTDKKL